MDILYALVKSIRRIEELATDTPTPDDAESALNSIKRECEDALLLADSASAS
jgi:hypothetical protein